MQSHYISKDQDSIKVVDDEGGLVAAFTGSNEPMKPAPVTAFRLSSFAYLRFEAQQLTLFCPLAKGKVQLAHPTLPAIIGQLGEYTSVMALSRVHNPPWLRTFLQLLQCCGALELKAKPQQSANLWTFHDLVFHANSRKGRQNGQLGGTYPLKDQIDPLPALYSCGTEPAIALPQPTQNELNISLTTCLNQRQSIRHFSTQPLPLTALADFLYHSARVDDQKPPTETRPYPYLRRVYPGGGCTYELEIYALTDNCEGLKNRLYHYNPEQHSLTKVGALPAYCAQLANDAKDYIDADKQPHVVFILAARFQRVSYKYEGIAYSLVLKNTGVLFQNFYLVATALGLAPCAVGYGNSDLFSKALGDNYYSQTSVGEFALGLPCGVDEE